jgi:aryl-alcohol dehydrogenase-like predicted oxidoreductase
MQREKYGNAACQLFLHSDKLIGRVLDVGINFIDTADVYSEGASEEIRGKALGKVVLA